MKTRTRALSVFLALALILALFGGAALAEDAAWLPEAMVEEQSFELEEETLTVQEEGEEAGIVEILDADLAYEEDEPFELDVHDITIGKGEKYELYPSTGGAIPTYKSSDTKIAKVGKDGTVTGVKPGVCTITATRNGEEDACQVEVMKAPGSVKLNYSKITLGYDAETGYGESFGLEYTLPDNTWSNLITLSGYNSRIVRVDDDTDKVTAVGVGSTKITVTTFNRKKATVKITVAAGPKSIALDRYSLTLGAGSSQAIKATLSPAKAGGAVIMTSDDENVAWVDEKNVVHAVDVGTCTITASCFNGVTTYCDVEVVPAPTWVECAPAAVELGVGQITDLGVTTDMNEYLDGGLSYTTSNKRYVTVTADGRIKAVKKGKATVTVQTYNGLSDTCEVTVVSAPSKITLSDTKLTLGTGDDYLLDYTLTKNTLADVTWTSSDEDVAIVEDGLVTAVGGGKAKITATTHNKKKATCTVTVVSPAAEIQIPEEVTLKKGKTTAFVPKVYNTEDKTYTGTVSYSFDPAGIATLTNGKLKGVKVGETVLTVTAGDIEESCAITVEGKTYGATVDFDETQIIAHRGGVGGRGIKENTLAAFEFAAVSGADGVELDVHTSKDGYQVVFHDKSVKGTLVKNMTLAQLRSKVGYYVPTLDEALDVVEDSDLFLHLELKDSANGYECVQAVQEHNLEDRTIYFGFYETPLKQVAIADPSAVLGLSLDEKTTPTSASVLNKAENLGITILVCYKSKLSASRVETLHDEGYLVTAWTPDSKSDLQKMLNYGVDFILTNYPERGMELR